MPIYIFYIRRALLNKIPQYVGLIPKLFDVLYNDEYLTKEYLKHFKDLLKTKTQFEILNELLNDKNNLLWKSRYLSTKDKQMIVDLNIDIFKTENYTNNEFLKLIEHLCRGHSIMEYGIYFGCKKCDNDIEFLETINQSNITDNDPRIVYYIQLDTLLNYIDEYQKNFDNPLVYFNTSWQYGNKEESSIYYNNYDRHKFIEYIERYTNEVLINSEIIVHIPLPVELFKFTYKQLGGNIPKKYTKGLSLKDKQKQVRSIKKSKKLYSKNKYVSRPKLKSFKSKKSSWTQKFQQKYPTAKTLNQIAKQTKIPKKALQEVKKKGMGAYYSSGSRPNQTAQSWGKARMYSYILGGPTRKYDKHITLKYKVKFNQ